MTPPVHIPGWGALLDDGTHVPQHAIDHAVELIARACAALEALPAEERAALREEVRGS